MEWEEAEAATEWAAVLAEDIEWEAAAVAAATEWEAAAVAATEWEVADMVWEAVAAMEWAVPATLRSRHFWVALVLSYLPFLAANGLLTALPIVWYDPARILGIRVGSIPWEDFFYSFSMLLLAILVHDSAGRWRRAA